MMNSNAIQRILDPLKSRVNLMISRFVIKAVQTSGMLQTIQGEALKGEVFDKAEHFQQYGYTAYPKSGSEGLLLAVGGNRGHPIIICVDDRRYRLTDLAEGEVALYTDEGDKIILKRGNKIEVHTQTLEITATTKVLMTTPLCEMTGNLKVDGNAQILGNETVGGTLVVTGAATAASVLAVGGISAGGAPSSGQITDSTGTMSNMRTIYNTHTHPYTDGGSPLTTTQPNQPM